MRKRLFLIGLFLLFFGFTFYNIGYWLSGSASKPFQADLIVDLGGDNGERGMKAAELFKLGYAKKILLTGMEDSSEVTELNYQHWRSQFLIRKGIPVHALIFDYKAKNTYEEAINISILLKEQHWQSVLVVSDPPHMRRLDYVLNPVFKKAGLHYYLIQSDVQTWHPERWWQDERWAQFCGMEMIKLIYYYLKYGNQE